MQEDSILREIHRIREKYAARFHYDLKAIYKDLQTRTQRGEFVVVHRSPRSPQVKVVPEKRVRRHAHG